MTDANSLGSAGSDIDPEQIEAALGTATETDGASGIGVANPTGRIWRRLMNRNPNPDLEEMDSWEERVFFTREKAFQFTQRALGKFTQVGGTALEDGVWAVVNFIGAVVSGDEDASPNDYSDTQGIDPETRNE